MKRKMINFAADIHQNVKEQAKRENRTIANMVEHMVKSYTGESPHVDFVRHNAGQLSKKDQLELGQYLLDKFR